MSEPGGYKLDLSTTGGDDPWVVSTGHLPLSATVRAEVEAAYLRFRDVRLGTVPTYYPALARTDPDLFGVAVTTTGGEVFAVGDGGVPFTIMSIAKPFVLAYVIEAHGPDYVRERVGVDATGYPFNSAIPIDDSGSGLSNPMVNPGALATTSLVSGTSVEDRWNQILDCLSRFSGRSLTIDREIFASASESNHRNRSLANLLFSTGRLYADPAETVDLYTRQSSVSVTTCDLAVMGATLANGGVNPRTGLQVVCPSVCRRVLAVMATAGMYEASGSWLYDVGLPGKSGVGGGIVTISPGKGSLATFAPPLDAAGNSVRGQLVARFLAQHLGLDLFSSDAESARLPVDPNVRTKE
ncbi:MAG: glutaminase A [Thermomicrobiales bacterium]|nr:glutaminase A [Thermomicrobiales bacterium]